MHRHSLLLLLLLLALSAEAAGPKDAKASSSKPAVVSKKLVKSFLLGGSAALEVEPGSEPGWVKVTFSSSSPGWLGFGVADPGA